MTAFENKLLRIISRSDRLVKGSINFTFAPAIFFFNIHPQEDIIRKQAMASPDIHIVSFAVPYPATYGGAIDVYNRVKALHKEGVKVHLHCFIYGQFSPHNALNEITSAVDYYPRISWPAMLSPGTPYIVASRRNPKLLECLQKDNVPVLFEGVHTTGFIDDLNGRKKFLRAHNIEHKYYGNLAKDSQRFQYLFFQRES